MIFYNQTLRIKDFMDGRGHLTWQKTPVFVKKGQERGEVIDLEEDIILFLAECFWNIAWN